MSRIWCTHLTADRWSQATPISISPVRIKFGPLSVHYKSWPLPIIRLSQTPMRHCIRRITLSAWRRKGVESCSTARCQRIPTVVPAVNFTLIVETTVLNIDLFAICRKASGCSWANNRWHLGRIRPQVLRRLSGNRACFGSYHRYVSF